MGAEKVLLDHSVMRRLDNIDKSLQRIARSLEKLAGEEDKTEANPETI